MPIPRKKINRSSSLNEAFRVWPRICSPTLCLDNLMIRKTLMTRTICKYLWLGSFLMSNISSIKNGIMARKSIQFMTSLINLSRLGQTIKRTDSSMVNQATQMPSKIKRVSLFLLTEFVVSKQNSITDRTIRTMLM